LNLPKNVTLIDKGNNNEVIILTNEAAIKKINITIDGDNNRVFLAEG
jgi:hypothetical protein